MESAAESKPPLW